MINYKKFRIGDLFEIATGRDIIISCTKEGKIPLISHQHDNNGIARYIDVLENRKLFDYESTIALADRGVFYATTQKEDFYIGTRVKALTFKDGKKSEKIRLFFVTAINKLQEMFKEYLENATDKLPNLLIELPVNIYNEIDYEYMETFISEMQMELIDSIKKEHEELKNKYLCSLMIKDFNLTENDNQIINKLKEGKINFKKTKIGDLFEVMSSRKKFNANTITFGGKYPYVVRSNINNGIKGYITEDVKYLNSKNTISFGQDTATIFYQENEYFTGDKIKILTFKHQELDRRLAFYLITAMKKSFQTFSWGQSSFNEQIIKDMEIEIPYVNDKIDYDFMRKYIEVQEKITINKIMEEKNENLIKISKLISD